MNAGDVDVRIVSTFGGLCTEMEGGAVAQTAYLNGIPFIVLRAISDEADDSATVDFPTFSKKASEIIKAKLMDNGGHITVYTLRGLPCEVWADSDGKSFISDKLPIKPPYTYGVFDIIVDLLSTQGGSARKGNGRNYRLGEPECDETTVVGAVAKYYNGKQNGESVFDPVFVFSAILEWAGIARNDRGELVLNAAYRSAE